jgi:hypothetical protein
MGVKGQEHNEEESERGNEIDVTKQRLEELR